MNFSRLAAISLILSSFASGVVITLNPSTQPVTFTGTGKNASGAGTSRLSWGACPFDGTTTTCTVSGTYTGLGNGGTYNFVLTYPGNGPSPLSAFANPIGSDFVTYSLSAGTFTFTITPTGGTPVRFYDLNFGVFYDPLTDSCTGLGGANCAVGVVGTTAGSTITGPVHGTADLAPVITPGGVITVSNYGAFSAIAPATWVEIYGQNLATTQTQTWAGSDFVGPQAPSALGGTTATVGGKPAFMYFVTPEQIDVQVPSGIPAGQQPVVVTTFGGSSVAAMVTVNDTQPGILAPASFKLALGQYPVAQFDANTYVLPPNSGAGVPSRRARPGDTLILYGIGFGTVTPDIKAGQIVQQANNLSGFTASIGGVSARVDFAGLVGGLVGLYQFNIVVPQVPAADNTPFTFSINGKAGTQTLILPIGN